MISNAPMSLPKRARQRAQQRDRGVVTSSATSAVCRAARGGCRRSTARVITPSVPSDPMNKLLQVVARIVLDHLAHRTEHGAVRRARLRGRAPGRAPCPTGSRDCRRHWSRDCRRSGTSRARRDRAQVRSPPPARPPARFATWCPRSTVMRRRRARRFPRRRQAVRATTQMSPRDAIAPPASPVMPPCGTTLWRASLQIASARDDLFGRARHDERRGARRRVAGPVGHRAFADLLADAHARRRRARRATRRWCCSIGAAHAVARHCRSAARFLR